MKAKKKKQDKKNKNKNINLLIELDQSLTTVHQQFNRETRQSIMQEKCQALKQHIADLETKRKQSIESREKVSNAIESTLDALTRL